MASERYKRSGNSGDLQLQDGDHCDEDDAQEISSEMSDERFRAGDATPSVYMAGQMTPETIRGGASLTPSRPGSPAPSAGTRHSSHLMSTPPTDNRSGSRKRAGSSPRKRIAPGNGINDQTLRT